MIFDMQGVFGLEMTAYPDFAFAGGPRPDPIMEVFHNKGQGGGIVTMATGGSPDQQE